MAQNANVSLVGNVWTQLTNANAVAVRVQNQEKHTIRLQATNGTTPPSNSVTAGSIMLNGEETLAADLTLAQLWPGVTGANRLWALSFADIAVSVSHADA